MRQQRTDQRRGYARSHWGGVVAGIAALVTYLPAIKNGFVWDDPLVLRQIRSIHTWIDLVLMPPEVPRSYYRPLVFLSYWIDQTLSGGTAAGFHLSVILFHVVNSVLVFLFAICLFPSRPSIANLGALLFAVFPTHVESVAWMAGRSDVLMCSFLLLSALIVLHGRGWTSWLAAAALFLALLSKEAAISGVIVIPAIDWLRSRRIRWRNYLPLILVVGVYVQLRRVNGYTFGGGRLDELGPDLLFRLLRAVGFYLAESAGAVHLSPYLPAVPSSTVYFLLGFSVPTAVLISLYVFWPAARWPWAYLALWFTATLAPSFLLLTGSIASAPVADRYLYVPSVASCIFIASAIFWPVERWQVRAGLSMYVGIAIALVCASITWNYSAVWADEFAFWGRVVKTVPESPLAQAQFGSALMDRGDFDGAERALIFAARHSLGAEYKAIAYNNLSLIYRRKGKLDESEQVLMQALEIAPHPGLYHSLGMTYAAKAQADQARGDPDAVKQDLESAHLAFETALSVGASSDIGVLRQWEPAKTHGMLGQVLLALGDQAAARAHFEAALRLDPYGPTAAVTRRLLEALK